jgi:D-serine deaminase-like pyridoxal phosphate-dependent protein
MKENTETSVWLDINNGMNRTGILPGDEALSLYRLINQVPMLNAEGLHVYDGHIREKDIISREMICNEAYLPVDKMINSLVESGYSPINVIAGGTPTFPIHANRKGVDVSPGTLLLWDYGYSSSFSDMDYLHASVLMMRVISKPAHDLICIDLGHKAISAEMPQPRVHFLNLENYSILNQSEEHLVLRIHGTNNLEIGKVLYGIPYHICPTVDRYDSVTVVKDGLATEKWDVDARKRNISY